jgi:hypothetical protein
VNTNDTPIQTDAVTRIVAPDESAIVPTSKPQPNGTLVKALARARRWQKLLDAGVSRSRGLPDKMR